MHWFRRYISVRPNRRQTIALLLVACLSASVFPIVVVRSPSRSTKDHSEPFPCQDRPCGCRTAAQCKTKCCCFTKEQKLAWAKRNGISVHKVVTAASDVSAPPEHIGCCSSKRRAKTNPDSQRTVLSKTESRETSSSRRQFVIGVVAQECQGVAQTLAGQSVFVLPPSVSLAPLLEPTGERFILEGWRFLPRFCEPPVPPPRMYPA